MRIASIGWRPALSIAGSAMLHPDSRKTFPVFRFLVSLSPGCFLQSCKRCCGFAWSLYAVALFLSGWRDALSFAGSAVMHPDRRITPPLTFALSFVSCLLGVSAGL